MNETLQTFGIMAVEVEYNLPHEGWIDDYLAVRGPIKHWARLTWRGEWNSPVKELNNVSIEAVGTENRNTTLWIFALKLAMRITGKSQEELMGNELAPGYHAGRGNIHATKEEWRQWFKEGLPD